MAYKELRELYYTDRGKYDELYKERFSSESSIRLDFDIEGNQAFFVQSEEVIDLLFRILRSDKEIYALQASLPKVALEQYSKKCLIDEIVVTNNIEGVHSSRQEIGAALVTLEEQSSQKGKKSVFLGLVNKYLKLLSHQTVALQTCQDIRKIYDEIVMEEVISEDGHNAPDGQIFRKEMTEIYNPSGKSIHKGKYPEAQIITYMEKALAFLNDKSFNVLYRICLFHYMLEYIHPFYDGNGRLGRFILSYCISENFERLLAFRISETIKENIKKYYAAFTACNDTKNMADLTPFLITMLEMMAIASDELKKSLLRRYGSWKRYEKIIPQLDRYQNEGMSTLYNVLIQASLFSERGISTQELLALFATNYTTIRKRLSIVENQDLLITEKQGNRKYYTIKLQELDKLIKD